MSLRLFYSQPTTVLSSCRMFKLFQMVQRMYCTVLGVTVYPMTRMRGTDSPLSQFCSSLPVGISHTRPGTHFRSPAGSHIMRAFSSTSSLWSYAESVSRVNSRIGCRVVCSCFQYVQCRMVAVRRMGFFSAALGEGRHTRFT